MTTDSHRRVPGDENRLPKSQWLRSLVLHAREKGDPMFGFGLCSEHEDGSLHWLVGMNASHEFWMSENADGSIRQYSVTCDEDGNLDISDSPVEKCREVWCRKAR